MAAVAERFVGGMFAGAPGNSLRGRDFRVDWCELGALVGTIAKGLGSRPPAGTPPILTRLDILHNGTLLENDWIAHAPAYNREHSSQQAPND